jgi:hypothetical protein
MVFNATFNNISAISWQLILLAEEMEVRGDSGSINAFCFDKVCIYK